MNKKPNRYSNIDSCPICESKDQTSALTCKDYTVSKDDFNIVQCRACGFAFTNPRPVLEELGAYYESDEYISHSNTKKGLVSSLYQRVRRRTLQRKLSLINALSPKGSLLDIGCGTGEFLNTMKQAGWNTTGIEPSASARRMGIENYKLDVREEPDLDKFQQHSFDVITMWHVMEHVPFLNERVAQLKRLLKQDGLLIVAVPNRTSHDADYYKEFWAAYDVPRHLWHFRPEDMRALMQKGGFEVKEIKPMKYDSYYVSLLSEKYKTGKSRLFSAFWRGWISNRKAGTEKWSSLIYIIRNK
ncbi:MAG TPA: class I SAM-dependent methyltransferase [Bacteroidia bacterium]|jgi:2-polyprenyl-3-methyl-5-hydroxy-6-metoxy-1,4-benzoquinol methylase|nr:class I SAM-dependent methyltransferase [Bacteroidia bacterium]